MTVNEALAFLGIEDPEDASDAFEEAVFTIRQQLIAGPALLKTTESRCKRLVILEEARSTIIQQKAEVPFSPETEKMELPEQVLERFRVYNQIRSKIQQKLASTLNVTELISLSNRLIELERLMVKPFEALNEWGNEQVTIGKEPDPMMVLKLLREQEEKGWRFVSDYYENKNNLPAELRIALKRLSLLKNYLYP